MDVVVDSDVRGKEKTGVLGKRNEVRIRSMLSRESRSDFSTMENDTLIDSQLLY